MQILFSVSISHLFTFVHILYIHVILELSSSPYKNRKLVY